MFKKTIVGGTFNKIHKGHKKLFEVAFNCSEYVIVGLTSDKFANVFRVEKVRKYEERKRDLIKFLKKFKKRYRIVKIDSVYGTATLDKDIEAITVSEETLERALEINAVRFKKGLERLIIIVVPFILKNNKPISSTKIF